MKILFIICTLLFSTASLSAREKGKDKIEALKNTIERTIASVDPNINIGIEVISLKTGEILYERNAKQLFIPASCVKLLTCAAALDQLGPEYQFETKVLKDEKGNLYILGGGDPSLDRQGLADLVMQTALTQEKLFSGDLIVDCSLFDTITNGPGWMWDEGHYYWNSPIDALLVDHSCVELWVVPKAIKTPPEVILQSGSDYVVIENRAVTTEEKGDLEVGRSPISRENKIEIRGLLNNKTPPRLFRVPVEFPHLYTAHLFRKILREKGISCKGEIHIGKVAKESVVIASHSSEPLAVLIRNALKNSDNLTANCLFKKLGQILEGAPGTWQNGSKALRRFLEERALLDIERVVLLDGSGESRYNLISPHHIVQCLRWISGQFAIAPEFLSALPLSGCDGSLKQRLQDPEICGKIRAKTGVMTGISSLSGFAESADGEQLIFSIIINGFTKPGREVKHTIEDPICQALVNFSRH